MNFREGIRRKRANRLWREWIARLEEIEGHRLSWARMTEVGEIEGNLHFHSVVAGVHLANPGTAELLWKTMAGEALIDEVYSNGWLGYMLKKMEHTDDYDIDLALFDEHLQDPAELLRRRIDDEF